MHLAYQRPAAIIPIRNRTVARIQFGTVFFMTAPLPLRFFLYRILARVNALPTPAFVFRKFVIK